MIEPKDIIVGVAMDGHILLVIEDRHLRMNTAAAQWVAGMLIKAFQEVERQHLEALHPCPQAGDAGK